MAAMKGAKRGAPAQVTRARARKRKTPKLRKAELVAELYCLLDAFRRQREQEEAAALRARAQRQQHRLAVMARRRRVARLLARRVGPAEIAQLEKIALRTVYKDIKAVQRVWQKNAEVARSAKVAIEQLLATSMERQRVAWQLYNDTDNDVVKASVLKTLQQEDAHILAVLQSLGALPKEADKLDITDWRQRLREIAAERQRHAEVPLTRPKHMELN